MTNLEGIINSLLKKENTRDEIIERIVLEYLTFKDISADNAIILASAVYDEVINSRNISDDELINCLLRPSIANATMHELGVGCRGEGDFFLHREIGNILYSDKCILGPRDQDDAGVVSIPKGNEDNKDNTNNNDNGDNDLLICAVDGTHSRLSDFPFIAGFHVARAALRDVYVKGGIPIGLIDDLHLADDGDVGKLIDFLAGVSAVARLNDVPVIAGSTLRIGGDMVIGDRMVSCVGAIGVCDSSSLTPRSSIKDGDKILLTEGAGGGTIATTGIYSGNPEIVKETLNVDFMRACRAIFDSGSKLKLKHKSRIHAMLDVTNGGLRGDANEVCISTGLGLIFEENKIKPLVNENVLSLLNKLGIDYLGVSIDSLLIFAPPELCDDLMYVVRKAGVKIDVVGRVVKEPAKPVLVTGTGELTDMSPLFRESAYTKIKKVIGEDTPPGTEEYKRGVRKSIREAKKKMDEVIKFINSG